MTSNNRNPSHSTSAVSPVIGVILMVAITMILAAVIAAFVFNISGNIQENPHPDKIVSCSNYQKVIDDYRTPNGRFLTIEGQDPIQVRVDSYNSENLKGRYASCSFFGHWNCNLLLGNLTPYPENESGMRDACRVEP